MDYRSNVIQRIINLQAQSVFPLTCPYYIEDDVVYLPRNNVDMYVGTLKDMALNWEINDYVKRFFSSRVTKIMYQTQMRQEKRRDEMSLKSEMKAENIERGTKFGRYLYALNPDLNKSIMYEMLIDIASMLGINDLQSGVEFTNAAINSFDTYRNENFRIASSTKK
jgi:hypothetical protein